MNSKIFGTLVATAVVGLMGAQVHADDAKTVTPDAAKSAGYCANGSCKGHAACKSANNESCAGKNTCKGHGMQKRWRTCC